jgi:hypothetical protein
MRAMKQFIKQFSVLTFISMFGLALPAATQAAPAMGGGGFRSGSAGFRGGAMGGAPMGYRGGSVSGMHVGAPAGYRGGSVSGMHVGAPAGYRGGSATAYHGGYRGGYSSAYYGGYYGYRGGYYGGYRGGYYGHNHNGYCGYYYYGGSWYPWWGLSFSYAYNATPYYYYPVAATYAPAVVYDSPPSSTAVYTSSPTPSTPVEPVVKDVQPGAQPQPMGPADVKALAKGGVSEDVILSQIRNSGTVFHLTTAEILDLKQSGVSDKIIDFMINTATPSH